MTYAFHDWQAGERPTKGFDVADCVENGWTREDVTVMMRAAVCDELPPFSGTRYSFADWQAGKPHPKDFDIADRIAYGWTKEQVQAMRKQLVCDELPDWTDEVDPTAGDRSVDNSKSAKDATMRAEFPANGEAQAAVLPLASRARGADGIQQMPRVMDIESGGEVGIAQHFAMRLEALCGDTVKSDGAFWAWGPTAWVEIDQQRLRLAVHAYNGATVGGKSPIKLSSNAIDGALKEVGTILGAAKFFAEPAVGLNARNGVIRIDRDGKITMHPHDPDDRFRFTIEAGFAGEAAMPPAGSLLYRLLDGAFRDDPDAADKINLIGEILGAAAFGMSTRLPQPKAFVFLGETASNGKSTIASLIECLLPDGAVAHIPPSALEDERRIIHLAGKAANVADELSAKAVAGEQLKSAITGNAIEGRDLYRSAMTFIPRAIHVFTTNVLPRFNGGIDRGLQRRLMVLRFNRSIPADEIIPDIASRIRSEELGLLLQFAVAGAQRLTMHRAYSAPSSSKDALKDWLRLDPLVEWVEASIEHVDHEPAGGWLRSSELFQSFKAWAIDQGHQEKFLPILSTFGQRLKAIPGIETRHTKKGTVVIGVALARARAASEYANW